MTWIGSDACDANANSSTAPARKVETAVVIFTCVFTALLLREGEGVKRAAAANHHELFAVELVRDRSVPHSSNGGVPQRCTVTRAKGHEVSGHIAGKRQPGL